MRIISLYKVGDRRAWVNAYEAALIAAPFKLFIFL